MPLSSEIVGRSGKPVHHTLDARWTMAYAAGLGGALPVYLDTSARADVPAHPLFPVCFEWPVFLSPEHLPTTDGLLASERVRGVHATHDLRIHRPIRAGIDVTTTATVVQVQARRPGAYQLTRLETVDANGDPVCSTWYGTLMRGVDVVGGDRSVGALPESPDGSGIELHADPLPIEVPANAAHVYTECARIWNPIHTDAAVALGAGLPEIILHGTATLALAVSRVVAERADGRPERVARIAARFAGMVRMPSSLELRYSNTIDGAVHFDVHCDGAVAVRNGLVELRAS